MGSEAQAYWMGRDLLMRSRVEAAGIALADIGVTAVPPSDARLVYVDLNREPEAALGAIAAWRQALRGVTIVGFCGHAESEVRRQAMAAGADRVVTNGALEAEARHRVTR